MIAPGYKSYSIGVYDANTNNEKFQNIFLEIDDFEKQRASLITYTINSAKTVTNIEVTPLSSDSPSGSQQKCSMVYFEYCYTCECANHGCYDNCSCSLGGPVKFVDSYMVCSFPEYDGPSVPTGPSQSGNQTGGGGGVSGNPSIAAPSPATAEKARKKAFSQKLRGLNLLVGFNELPENTQGEIWNFLESSLTNGEFTVIATLYPEEVVEFITGLIEDCENQNLNNQDAHEYIVSNIIEEQIDDSQLDDCTKGVLSQLKNLQQNDISKIFRKLNATESVYKTVIKTQLPTVPGALAGTNYIYNDTGRLRFNYIIKINPSHSSGALRGTTIGIASTILHELIHAYFFSMIDDCYITNQCSQLEQFSHLWNHYVQNNYNGNTTDPISQHNEIANSFVNVLASAIQEFATGLPVPANQEPQQLYKDLAWGELVGTVSYDNLSQIDKDRITAVNNSENYNQSAYNPSGVVVATPQGTPCN